MSPPCVVRARGAHHWQRDELVLDVDGAGNVTRWRIGDGADDAGAFTRRLLALWRWTAAGPTNDAGDVHVCGGGASVADVYRLVYGMPFPRDVRLFDRKRHVLVGGTYGACFRWLSGYNDWSEPDERHDKLSQALGIATWWRHPSGCATYMSDVPLEHALQWATPETGLVRYIETSVE